MILTALLRLFNHSISYPELKMEEGRKQWPPQRLGLKAILRTLDNHLLEEPGYIFTVSYFVASNLAISSVTWKTKTGSLERSLLEAENCGRESQLLIKCMGHAGRCHSKHLLSDETDWNQACTTLIATR